jgi:hypothetical protein
VVNRRNLAAANVECRTLKVVLIVNNLPELLSLIKAAIMALTGLGFGFIEEPHFHLTFPNIAITGDTRNPLFN